LRVMLATTMQTVITKENSTLIEWVIQGDYRLLKPHFISMNNWKRPQKTNYCPGAAECGLAARKNGDSHTQLHNSQIIYSLIQSYIMLNNVLVYKTLLLHAPLYFIPNLTLLPVQFKSLLHGQEGCIFFSGNLNLRTCQYV
jgi:hypothetical protein